MSATTAGGRQRIKPAAPGRRVVAAPAQRAIMPGQRGATAGARRRPGTAMPRRPALTLVPPLQTGPKEQAAPEGLRRESVPAAKPGAEVKEQVRRTARQVPVRTARVPAGRGRPRTRLTRRGRIVVSALVMAAMLLVAALAWIAGAAKADAAGSGPPPSAVYRNLVSVVVQPGQSLWTIAAQAEPSADPRSVIQQIIDLNALSGTSIQPGQHLWVP